jgi:hypothetical protein
MGSIREVLCGDDPGGNLPGRQGLASVAQGFPDKPGELAALELCPAPVGPMRGYVIGMLGGKDGYGCIQVREGLAQPPDPLFRFLGLDADFVAAFPQHRNGMIAHAQN